MTASAPRSTLSRPARRRFLATSLALAPAAIGGVSLLRPSPALAATAPIYTSLFSDKALGGYDPVAYFTEGRAVKGSSAHRTEWRGATWQFAGADNLDAFVAEPERWAPAYGGYCAYAMAQGQTAKGDPEQWTIVGDRLFVNYDAEVKALWRADPETFIRQADGHWPNVLGA